MSGFVLNALSTAGSFGCWGLRQLVHTVEINLSGPWVYPQALSKVACLAAAYLAYYAPSSDLKKAYVACSLTSLVANYAFRKVHLSDLELATKTAALGTLKEKDDAISHPRGELNEAKEKNRRSSGASKDQFLELTETIAGLQNALEESQKSEAGTAEANKFLLVDNESLANVHQSLIQENEKLTREKEELAKALAEAKNALPKDDTPAATSADSQDGQKED